MPIPDQAYNLDDRRFQDLVYEARRRIPELCPQWTDHNLSDPGITMIELFASMVEQVLFRMNKVPDKNYIKFLDLIGVNLRAASAAATDLTFRFSTSLPDAQGVAEPIVIRSGTQVSNNVDPDSDEAIVFTTDENVRVTAPKLEHAMLCSSGDGLFVDRLQGFAEGTGPYDMFQKAPVVGDAFYLGFTTDSDAENDIRGVILSLAFLCADRAASGINPDSPPLTWEYWNGAEWMPFQRNERSDAWLESDSTMGFNQDGNIVLHVPHTIRESAFFIRENENSSWRLLAEEMDTRTVSLNGHYSHQGDPDKPEAYWIRCRVSPPGPNQRRYRASPQIAGLSPSATGCTVSASNALTMRNEILGRSTGKTGQRFKVSRDQMLPLRDGQRIYGRVEEREGDDRWIAWRQVDDFSESGPEDRHFVCQEATGEILFGPVIGDSVDDPDPDRSTWDSVLLEHPIGFEESVPSAAPKRWIESQHGRIPKAGSQMRISAYRYGGGQIGNVPPDTLTELRTTVEYIDSVTNRRRAAGGVNPEKVDDAISRGPEHFRTMDRAVTAADFEYLARQASPAVGRAKCIQPKAPAELKDSTDGRNATAPVPPGRIYVRIFPQSALERGFTPDNVLCRPELRMQVEDYLEERRLLGSVLLVEDANCKWVSVKSNIMALPDADPVRVREDVEAKLYQFIHPLKGGHDGNGWPFGKTLVVSELYHQIQEVSGVAYVKSLFVDVGHPELNQIEELDPQGEIGLDDTEILCSREHIISVERL